MRQFYQIVRYVANGLHLSGQVDVCAFSSPADQFNAPCSRVSNRKTQWPRRARLLWDAACQVVVVAGVHIDPQVTTGIIFLLSHDAGFAGNRNWLTSRDDGFGNCAELIGFKLGKYTIAINDHSRGWCCETDRQIVP